MLSRSLCFREGLFDAQSVFDCLRQGSQPIVVVARECALEIGHNVKRVTMADDGPGPFGYVYVSHVPTIFRFRFQEDVNRNDILFAKLNIDFLPRYSIFFVFRSLCVKLNPIRNEAANVSIFRPWRCIVLNHADGFQK